MTRFRAAIDADTDRAADGQHLQPVVACCAAPPQALTATGLAEGSARRGLVCPPPDDGGALCLPMRLEAFVNLNSPAELAAWEASLSHPEPLAGDP